MAHSEIDRAAIERRKVADKRLREEGERVARAYEAARLDPDRKAYEAARNAMLRHLTAKGWVFAGGYGYRLDCVGEVQRYPLVSTNVTFGLPSGLRRAARRAG